MPYTLRPPSPGFSERIELEDHTGDRVWLYRAEGQNDPTVVLQAEGHQDDEPGEQGVCVWLTLHDARALRDFLNRLDLDHEPAKDPPP